MDDELTLEDLASQSGLSLRTVRYYIQEGLLPGPDTLGKNARYSRKHLDRLELIQKFKKMHQPLSDIRMIIRDMTSEQVTAILEDPIKLQEVIPELFRIIDQDDPLHYPGSSALAYIHHIEKGQPDSTSKSPTAPSSPQHIRQTPAQEKLFSTTPFRERSKAEPWQRVVVKEGVELNFRAISSRDEEVKIDKLIAYAQRLFREK